MTRHRICLLALAALAAGAAPRAWAGPPTAGPDDARRLAARIDEMVEARLAQARVRPGDPADDAAILRRLSLDLVGKVAPVSDVRRFLADPSSDKRARAVDRLLDSPGYVNHFTNIWVGLLMPEANADFQRRYLIPGLEGWVHQQFAANAGFDRMVRELLTVPLKADRDAMLEVQFAFGGDGVPSARMFYMAKEGKPEELAASTARLFLGVRLECAQCHDHPFGRWTREQFWGQAAFFAGIKRPRNQGDFFFGNLTEAPDRRELAIPGTERIAQARFLDGKEPRWQFKVGARTTLADWMTAKDNPFFARAAVNRMWAHFFGLGIVEPVDDFSDANPPSHPELLDELAREFAAHDFDFKFLIRAITLSRTYQRSSVYAGGARPDPRLFACMAVKGLSADQLYESIAQVTGLRDGTPRNRRAFFFGGPRNEFMDKFTAQEKRTEVHTSIPQALALMNSGIIAQATHPEQSNTLAAVAHAPFMTTAGRVETLFLAALGRKPRPEEAEKLVRYVDGGGAAGDKKKALADVFWALLNSTEFIFNH
jgi:hypothetical protein